MSRIGNFHQAFAPLLGQNLKKFADKRELNRAVCLEIYQTIFNTVTIVVESSNLTISNEALNYVAQCYYDGILINNNQPLDPNIFSQRASLENISSKDLVALMALLDGTDFKAEVVNTFKRRN